MQVTTLESTYNTASTHMDWAAIYRKEYPDQIRFSSKGEVSALQFGQREFDAVLFIKVCTQTLIYIKLLQNLLSSK